MYKRQAIANPRQIERTVAGSVFELDLIYELEKEEEFIEDMETLAEGMKLLQYDYPVSYTHLIEIFVKVTAGVKVFCIKLCW